jgi:hypothetical protein
VYFGRRYYAPNIGRWITPDPIGFNDGPNLYAYVHNNPLNSIDLYGFATVNHRETSWYKEQKNSKSEPNRDKGRNSENRYSNDKDSKKDGSAFRSNLSTENLLDMYDDDFFDRELVRNYSNYAFGIVAGATALAFGGFVAEYGVISTLRCVNWIRSNGKTIFKFSKRQQNQASENIYPTADSAHNRFTHELYKKELRRQMETPFVRDVGLEKIIKYCYKQNPNSVGNGSTAAAIRHELSTGKQVMGRWHSQKGKDTIRSLESWFKKNSDASSGDRAAAENILKDLYDALDN